MRRPEQSPSIVPPGEDHDVYLVLDDFGGRIGQSWRETDVEHTDLETLIEDLLEDQYSNPVRIVAFNTAEGWSRNVSEEVAQILSQRCAKQSRDLVSSVQEFVDRYQNPRLAKR
jgi:hypothetical protein